MSKHAILSPSGAHLWTKCSAAPRMHLLHPEEPRSSYYADKGTAAHYLASSTLDQGLFFVPASRLGEIIEVEGGASFIVDDEMVACVDEYLSRIEGYKEDGILMVEQRLDISKITGEENAKGTADAVIIRGGELQIHDLKTGRGRVGAENNPSLLIYAMAAYTEYSPFFEINSIRIKIHQPPLDAYPEWSYTLEEFWAAMEPIILAAEAATGVLNIKDLDPGFFAPGDHCENHYCKARAHCPAFAKWCRAGEDEDPSSISVDQLAALAKRVPTIRKWCESIESRLHGLVLGGEHVPGFKVVLGKQGNRTWDDEAEVEKLIKSMKISKDVLYIEKIKSAPQLIKEKEAGRIGPRQWNKIEPHITRGEPKPIVVPEDDKRQAIEIDDDFEDLTAV